MAQSRNKGAVIARWLMALVIPDKRLVYDSDPVPSQSLVWSPWPVAGELLAVFKPVRTHAGLQLAAGAHGPTT